MTNITINSAIFPCVFGINIGEDINKSLNINLPVGANILYLESINDEQELTILKKYSNNEELTDIEVETMLKMVFNGASKPALTGNKRISFLDLEYYGVKLYEEKFILISDWIPYIRKETWECIAIDYLIDTVKAIIYETNFDEKIPISLSSWKSNVNPIEQSLLNAFRTAFMFTLINYLYGDNRNLYDNFQEFFTIEFSKRIRLIRAIWVSRKHGEEIKYIPIFDSFYNLQYEERDELVKKLGSLFNNEQINKSDKDLFRETLIGNATKFHKNKDEEGLRLEKSLIKPVVNFIGELSSANERLKAAKVLHEEKLYEDSITRSYYSMLHALKALLESKGRLPEWDNDKLNVNENHRALQLKLIQLKKQKQIDSTYLYDFIYVKDNRWHADYSLSLITNELSYECLVKAERFLDEVKRITS